MPVAVMFYDVVVFVHVLAVILAFGPTFAYSVFLSVAERSDPRSLPVVLRGIQAWDRIAGPILIVLIGAGLYLTIDRWEFSDFYISWGFAAIIVLAGLQGAYFAPRGRAMIEVAERDIEASSGSGVELSDEYHALNRQLGRVGMFAGILVVLTIYVMTAKPFL